MYAPQEWWRVEWLLVCQEHESVIRSASKAFYTYKEESVKFRDFQFLTAGRGAAGPELMDTESVPGPVIKRERERERVIGSKKEGRTKRGMIAQ